VSEGSKPENILTGVTWEGAGTKEERWAAPMEAGPAWIKLEWDTPVTLSQVQLTHDTGLYRRLTMSAARSVQEKMQVGPQQETISDYAVICILPDGSERELASVTRNYQRLRRHSFDPVKVKAVRIDIKATHGPEARLYEVRAYA
jgi:hypothetical protein